MSRKWMFVISVFAVCGLVLAPIGIAQAQDRQPSNPTLIPTTLPHYPPARSWKGYADISKGIFPSASAMSVQNNGRSNIAPGQPGLSFRYVQTFGTTGEPYLVDSAHLNRPIGLFMDGTNNLYVTEDFGNRVLKYNSIGSNLLALGKAGVCITDNYMFCSPKDAALDVDGDLWIADGNRVVEYDASGNFIQQLPATDPWMSGDDDTHFNWVNGIAFDSIGRMYVSDTNNHRVQVYTFSSGSPVYHSTIGITGISGNDSTHFNSPYRLAVDSSNRVYVVDQVNNRVQRCTLSGGWTCATFDGGLNGPYGITIDGSDNIYIADTFNGRIHKCVSVGGCTDFVTNTYGFYDLAVDSSGNVYGAATYEGIVVKYNSGGGVMGIFLGEEFVPYLTDNSHYFQPRVAIDGQNNIIILEELGQRLTKLNSNGIFMWSVGVPGVDAQDNDHFMYPHGVATDPNGNIYVADNNRVQIFSGTGTYLHTIGGNWGLGNYEFGWASGIAVDSNGTIYVSDCPNQRVQVYNSSRIFVATIGETGVEGSDNGHLICPIGVGVDSARNIYVADAGNNRVQKFNSSRVWQMTLGTPGPWGSGSDDFDHFSSGPEDIDVDTQGRIYVADIWNNRVQVFDSSGAYLTTIGGAWGDLSSQFRGVSGVAVDSQGNVYVSDFTNARIQKFAPGVPGWQQANINGFGERWNTGVSSLEVFNGMLYAGAPNWSGAGASIWRTGDGSNWSSAMESGFGFPDTNPAVIGMAVFQNQLYAGTGWGGISGQLWRSADGTTWNQITGNGIGVSTGAMGAFAVFNNTLYVGTCGGSGVDGAQIWRSTTGDSLSWASVVTGGNTTIDNSCITSLGTFNSSLYAAVENQVTGAQIWRSATGNSGSWTQVNTSGFGSSSNDLVGGFAVFNDYLYIGTHNLATGAQLWRSSNGTTWNPVMTNGFGDVNNNKLESLVVLNGALYAGLSNDITGIEAWGSLDGTTWNQLNIDGFGDNNNVGTLWSNATKVFNNNLYVGTWNGNGNGGEIWKKLPVPLPSAWVGGVSITSNKNVVTVGRPHIGSEVASYDGFSAGSLSAYVPMLFKGAFGSYDAALYIQNVHATNTANVTIKYYNDSGVLNCTKTDTITALSSKGYWLPSVTCDSGSLPAGWTGGVVVTSSQPIVAVGRPHVGGEVMTYNGFASGSLSTYIPMLFKGAFGGSYNAAFYVQNTHASNTANLTIKYYNDSGVLDCTKTDTLSPLASRGYWVPAATCDSGSLPAGWVGGVVVTSDQPIVAVGRPHIGTQVTTYTGFATGSGSSYVPMLFKGAFGGSYNAAFYVQNTHASNSASLTIQYYDSSGTLNCTKTDTLAPLASKGYWVPATTCDSGSLPAGWVGGVVVTSNQPIVAVGRPHIDTQVTTYNGFTSGSLNSYLPMLFKAAFGSYNAAFYIQNTEATTATVILKFYDTNGVLSCTRADTIPALSTLGYWVPSITCNP